MVRLDLLLTFELHFLPLAAGILLAAFGDYDLELDLDCFPFLPLAPFLATEERAWLVLFDAAALLEGALTLLTLTSSS